MFPRQWFPHAMTLYALPVCIALSLSAPVAAQERYLFVTVPEAAVTVNGKPVGKVYATMRLIYKKTNGTHYLVEYVDDDKNKSGWVAASTVFLEPALNNTQLGVIIRAKELYESGKQAQEAEKFTAARKALDECLKLRKSVHGLSHPETADALNLLGVICMELDDPTQAERHYQQALDIRTKLLGADHPATIVSVNNLAQVHKSRRDFAKAEPLYRQALERSIRAKGADHIDTADVQNNFGLLLLAQGDFEEAEPLLRKSLATRSKALGPKHADTVTSCCSVAELLEAKNDFAAAEPLYRQALEALQETRGDDYPQTAETLENLGLCLERQAKHAEAEPVLKRALAARRQQYGAGHPQTLRALVPLAVASQAAGKTADAEPLYRQAIELRRKSAGSELAVAALTDELAKLVRGRGDSAAADELEQQAKQLRERLETPIANVGAENRFALVIGNGAYVGNELKNPSKDAEAIEAALKQLNFQVTKKVDLNRRQMQDAVAAFRRRLTKDSVALFFFAGHGLQVNGENFLVPVNAHLEEEYQVSDECFKVDQVLAALDDSKAALKILILDSCRHNPFTRGWATRGAKTGQGLAALTQTPNGTIIAFSTSPGKAALDGRGDNSPYTKHLVACFRSRPPEGLEIIEVFREASRAVKKEIGQVPWLNLDASLDKYYLWRETKP